MTGTGGEPVRGPGEQAEVCGWTVVYRLSDNDIRMARLCSLHAHVMRRMISRCMNDL